jgi:anti-sigma factor RsiW
MTCREAIAVLADYLDLTLDEAAAQQLAAHLAGCDECRAYLATYRRAVGAAAESARAEMPHELRQRLRIFLLERLRGAG